jgi:hypothetical protein
MQFITHSPFVNPLFYNKLSPALAAGTKVYKRNAENGEAMLMEIINTLLSINQKE